MNDQVDEIKQKNNIVDVVGQYVSLKKNGRHHKGLCPFHKEKTPSFLVNDELGLYKCFGCGAGGDVIKFVMEIEGVDFLQALEKLASRVGIKLERTRSLSESKKDDLYEVMDLAMRYYNWLLVKGKSGEEARKYLGSRKISLKIMETYKMGFSLPAWDGLIKYLTQKKGYKIELLERAGLVVKKQNGGYYDKFRGRIMFPLCDAGGRVVGFTGRVIPGLAKETEPKYLNSPETEIYHKGRMLFGFHLAKQAIRESKRVILVEGQMDQISSYVSGITETVASSGTAITEDQIEMIARLAERICVSLDADTAGYAAMKKTVELSEKRGLGVKVVQLDGGKDPDEIARNSPSAWKKMVDLALDVYEFVMNRSIKMYGSETVEGISKVLSEVVPFLAKIDNSVIREVWSKRLSEKLGVSLNSVVSEIEKNRTGKIVNLVTSSKQESSSGETKLDKMTKMLIVNLLTKVDLRIKVKKLFEGLSGVGATWKLLVFVLNSKEVSDLTQMIKSVPAELVDLANDLYLKLDELELDERQSLEVAVNLAREKIKETRSELYMVLEQAEKAGDEKKEEEVTLRLRDLGERENKLFSIDLP